MLVYFNVLLDEVEKIVRFRELNDASQSLFGIGDDRARTEERMLSTDAAARY